MPRHATPHDTSLRSAKQRPQVVVGLPTSKMDRKLHRDTQRARVGTISAQQTGQKTACRAFVLDGQGLLLETT